MDFSRYAVNGKSGRDRKTKHQVTALRYGREVQQKITKTAKNLRILSLSGPQVLIEQDNFEPLFGLAAS